MAYQDVVLADGPIGYWRLGETTGTQAADSSGNGHHGTYTGLTRGVLGAIQGDANTAITGTGAAGEIVSMGVVPALEFAGTASFSVEAWYKIFQSNGTEVDLFRSHKTHGVQLALTGINSSFGASIGFWLRNQAGGGQAVFASGVPRDGQWHHAVGVKNSDTGYVYVDGVLMASGFLGNLVTYPTTDAGVAIGPWYTNSSFIGFVDEVAVYDRVLTLAEVQEHYAYLRFEVGWRQKTPPALPTGQRIGPASFALNGKLYMVAGRTSSGFNTGQTTVYAYDPATHTVTQKANFSGVNVGDARGTSTGTRGYTHGGVTTGSSMSGATQWYDDTSNTWNGALTGTARYGAAVVYSVHPTHGAGFYAAMGQTTTFQFYQISSNTWITLAATNIAPNGVRGLMGDDGKLYVFGNSATTNILQAYDPATNTWSTKASPTNWRLGHGWVKKDGVFWAIGGSQTVVQSTVEAYNPSTNTWSAKDSLGQPHSLGIVEMVGTKLFAWAGDKNGTSYPTMQVYIDPPIQMSATLTGQGVVAVPKLFMSATLTGAGVLEGPNETVRFEEVTAPGFIDMGHVTPQLPDD